MSYIMEKGNEEKKQMILHSPICKTHLKDSIILFLIHISILLLLNFLGSSFVWIRLQVRHEYHFGFLFSLYFLCMKVKVAQSSPTLCNPMDSTVQGILQARILEWVAFPFSSGPFQPGDQTQVFHITGCSLPAEPQGKPKNIRVGSLSLLQQIFPTQ